MGKSKLVPAGVVAIVAAAISFGGAIAAQSDERASDAPRYVEGGHLAFPARYREWVFLSSSIDMSYSERPVHQFDNVFAPRAAYRAFLKNGVWPDKTVLILENRGAASKGSITRSGQFQNGRVIGLEAHVKDLARFKGGWGFFEFEGNKPGDLLPDNAGCIECHEQHAAADTSFVQFYPTLLPAAMEHGTLSLPYLAETKE